MLSIPATGLLNASPAVKTQQPQRKYNMPALKSLDRDITAFTGWQTALADDFKEFSKGGEGDVLVVEIMSKVKDNKKRIKALEHAINIAENADEQLFIGGYALHFKDVIASLQKS